MNEIRIFEISWYYIEFINFLAIIKFQPKKATLGYVLTISMVRKEECNGVICLLKHHILGFQSEKVKIAIFIFGGLWTILGFLQQSVNAKFFE